MNAPRIEIDLGKIEHNARVLTKRLALVGISVTGITKATLGSPGVGAAMQRGGVGGLGDSRVLNLARLSGGDAPDASLSRMLIRSPMLSEVVQIVQTATVSLNTERVVLSALDAASSAMGDTHDVVLMVELGDLREGISVEDVAAAADFVLTQSSLRLVGVGTNLACQNGVVPDADNMAQLSELAGAVETRHGVQLEIVSGGNSANLDWALSGSAVGKINHLRLGESILLGTEPLHRVPIDGLHTDAFRLIGEVIEVADKPALPWGTQAQAAYGVAPVRTGSGLIRQAIVAIGRQDVDLDGLHPPEGIAVLGMSSDHLVLNVGDHSVAVGDEIAFGLGYGALLQAMTSPFVHKAESGLLP